LVKISKLKQLKNDELSNNEFIINEKLKYVVVCWWWW
jgi:hypothetical protein